MVSRAASRSRVRAVPLSGCCLVGRGIGNAYRTVGMLATARFCLTSTPCSAWGSYVQEPFTLRRIGRAACRRPRQGNRHSVFKLLRCIPMNMPLAKTIIGTFLASILLSLLLVWPASAQQPPAPERPLVFVPGLLGSSLCRPGADGQPIVVWGSIDALGHFPSLAVDSDANEIVPCGLL